MLNPQLAATPRLPAYPFLIEWRFSVGALHATPSATMLLISSKITVSALKGLWVLCSRVLTFSFGWRRTFSVHYS